MRWLLLGLVVLGVFLARGVEAGHCAGGREVWMFILFLFCFE